MSSLMHFVSSDSAEVLGNKLTLAPEDELLTTTTPYPSKPRPTEPPPKPAKSPKHDLRSTLLAGYDKYVHPVRDNSRKVTVGVGMAVIHLDVDEMRSVMSVDAWMRLSWVDEHLQWNPSDYDGVSSIHFGFNELWRPDILLYNRLYQPTVGSDQGLSF